MSQQLKIDLSLDAKGYKEGAQTASYATKTLQTNTEEYLKSFGSLRKQLGAAKKDAQNLAAQFAALSDSEKASEFGQELAESLQVAIEKAAELQDVMADTNDAIKNAASDTAGLDALKESLEVGKELTMAYAGAVAKLTGDEKQLNNVIATLAMVQGSYNAVIKATNMLQKNSATMIALQRAGVLSLAQAEKISAAATNAATIATKGLGVAMKALPIIGIAAGTMMLAKKFVDYMSGANKAVKETKNLEEELTGVKKTLNDVGNTFNGNYANSLGKTLGLYKQLQNQYKQLSSEHEKKKWIQENADKMKELGLSVTGVNDADRVLIKQSKDVIESFKLRAQAAAEAARLQDLYVKRIEAETEARKRANKKQIKAGESVQAGDVDRFGLQEGIDYTQYKHKVGMFYTDAGAMKAQQALAANNIRTYTKEIDAEIQASAERLQKAEDEYDKALGNLGLGGKNDNKDKVTKEQKTRLENLSDKIKDIEKQIQNLDENSPNFEQLKANLKKSLDAAIKEELDYKIEIDYDVKKEDVENLINKIDNQIKQAQSELDNIDIDVNTEEGKQKVEELQNLIESLTGEKNKYTAYIDVKFPTDPVKQFEQNLKDRMDKAKYDFTVAYINGDEAGMKAAKEAYEAAQKVANESSITFKAKVETDKSEVDNIMKELYAPKDKQYDVSFLPEKFKDQAEEVIERLKEITSARQKLQDIIDKNENADDVAKANEALAATDGEYQKLIADAQRFNDVSDKIKERQKDFESFKNTISQISNVTGAFDSVVSSITSMTDAFEEGKNAWEQFMAIMNVAMTVMNAVITVMEIINTIQDIMNVKKAVAGSTVQAEAIAHAANATAQGTEIGTTTALAAVQTASIAPAIGLAKAMEKLAAANIFAAHSYIPFAGPAIAAGFVTMMETLLATVGAFAHGGIIEGNSYHGDRLIANVNSGEMILNQSQQKRLLDIANGMESGTGNTGNFTLSSVKVQGRDLVLCIKNELKSTGQKSILG